MKTWQDYLADGSLKRLPRWGENILGAKKPDATIELILDGQPICRTEVFKRECAFDGETFKLGGIGGVWTASKYRRQGHATAMLKQALSLFGHWGLDGAILFSLEELVPYYAERGFDRHMGAAVMHQQQPGFPVPENVVVLTHGFNVWLDPESSLEIRGLPW